ncbi:D-alanyl-D-alanine carboxypeptidase [Streptomyces monashensis]|uniref:serine-type D-Ala-D-Ala carboxypeptidase n=1 Tax=Streptomyces monashensis TaxID=1678012 RepID=A0A1S2QNN9_9ACTN|nr:D-alanyl-D-alanine carboxypeptidase [Streptomyces monashensis]
MAGESPDRSKQRESSAEPTPGNGGSVPETPDPRLAVSREKDSSGGGVDTATKILTVRDTAESDADAADTTDAADPADSGERAETESTTASEADAALRDAVSAWVRGADGDTKSADPKSAKSTEPEDTADTAPETEADTAAETDTEALADAKDSIEDEDGDTEKADTEAESKAEDAVTADAEADAEAEDAEVEDAEVDAEAPEAREAAEKTEAGAEAEKIEAGAEAEKAEAGAEAEKTEAAEATEADGAPEKPEDGGGPGADDGEDAPSKASAKDDEAEAADGRADAPQAKAVDQPTAVFKTVRKPQVDQPTTMLKLGGAAKSPKAPESPQDPASDPERTSKFVALKPDLREPKPEAKADVTTPVPQVGPERTTQQPLPPKPPLDLLAELTNTPPPPETPVRTLVRRVKIWTPLVALLAIVFVVVQALRPLPSPTLALTAKDSYTFDGGAVSLPWPSEGQGWMDGDGIGTMGHFGTQTPVAIGSVAKTMTSYIILRDHPLKPGEEGPRIKVDSTAEKEGGYDKSGESTLNTIKAGDYLTEKQALSAVMIPSANNIARLLARWDAGSEAAFVTKMNATAKELGMTHTTYTDPSGLKETTVSTAEDQVKIGRAVVKIPALVAITSAASWTDPSGKNWPNWNALPYRMGAIGIKTGSTTAAGGNLLFASRKSVGGQTVTIVGAILGQHKPSILDTVNQVSQTALTGAQQALTGAKILKKGDVVGYVDDQLGGQTPIVVTEDVTAVGWSGLKVKLSFASDTVPHTAKAGTTVGTLTVGDGSAGAVKVPVALQKDLAEPGFGAKLMRVS